MTITLPSSLHGYFADLQTTGADRLFKANGRRISPAERADYPADAHAIQLEIGHLVTWGSTHVRPY